ncbi:MAG: DUF368 domain-containing protein [Chlamydiales bacterium]|nr:DUF368 domain-containing protein [Chlamydiia bacterium]MCP5508658.1 DUF368 domain-containing protein [Chlamydiales bacterium]
MLVILLYGFCMGAADVVPGVSGGTVAFILGFYEQLIDSIRSIDRHAVYDFAAFRWKKCFARVEWRFLLPLVVGIVTAVVTISGFFQFLLHDPVYRTYLYAAFFGLVVSSAFFCGRQLKHWSPSAVYFLLAGILVAFLLTGTQISLEARYDVPVKLTTPYHIEIGNYDASSFTLLNVPESALPMMLHEGIITDSAVITDAATGETVNVNKLVQGDGVDYFNLWIVFCGIVAACAMLLPGVSGSYMLVILGVYPAAIGAVADLSQGNVHAPALLFLANLALGVCIGILLFSRAVSWMLHHYHDVTMAMLLGLMVGALRAVWPFWSYEYLLLPTNLGKGPQLHEVKAELPDFSSQIFFVAVAIALAAFIFVQAAEWLSRNRRDAK